MKKLKVETVVPVLFLAIFAFCCGFIVPDVRASGVGLHELLANIQVMPERIADAAKMAAGEDEKKPLPIIETYSLVLDKLEQDYYGQKIDKREITYSAIRGMLHALEDPFTRFLSPEEYKEMREENEGNFTGIGAQLSTNENGEIYIFEPLPDTPAMSAGVKAKDVIIAVDGKPIEGMDIRDVVKIIRGPEGTDVTLTVRRPGADDYIDIVITRAVVQFRMVKWRMADEEDKIGYVRLYQFNEQSDAQLDEAMTELEAKGMKALVFDLRGNPGGLLDTAVEIGSRFIDSGPVVTIQTRQGIMQDRQVDEYQHNHAKLPLVVLVDKSSASASEIVSGAIKDNDEGTLVGTTTFGKGRVQEIIPLQDGSAVAITTAKYLTPKGTDIHKKGIEPDIYVKASDDFDPNDPATDVQLQTAVKVLKVKLGTLPKGELAKIKKESEKAREAEQKEKKEDKHKE